jgi:hypothetical protein
MLEQAEYDMTDMAMGQQGNSGERPGDDTLAVRFFNEPRQDMERTAKEGRPIYTDAEYVEIRIPGDRSSVFVELATDRYKRRFARHYEAFQKRTAETTDEGTPLIHAPWITRSQVEELKFFGVRTVEHLAHMSDANAQNFMGIQKLRELAQNYLQQAEDAAPLTQLQAELENRDAQIAGLAQQLEDMKELIEAQAEED